MPMGGAIINLACVVACIFLLQADCASSAVEVSASAPPNSLTSMRDQWGVEVSSIRLSAYGRMIDFRYRVIDPEKAAMLGNLENKAYLIDQATGVELRVPSSAKIGSLRQASAKLEAGRVYFMIFANSGLVVKRDSKVTVIVGDFRAENLTVQ